MSNWDEPHAEPALLAQHPQMSSHWTSSFMSCLSSCKEWSMQQPSHRAGAQGGGAQLGPAGDGPAAAGALLRQHLRLHLKEPPAIMDVAFACCISSSLVTSLVNGFCIAFSEPANGVVTNV